MVVEGVRRVVPGGSCARPGAVVCRLGRRVARDVGVVMLAPLAVWTGRELGAAGRMMRCTVCPPTTEPALPDCCQREASESSTCNCKADRYTCVTESHIKWAISHWGQYKLHYTGKEMSFLRHFRALLLLLIAQSTMG